jgi:uncharacterized cupredoxin-like copper-binding protein
VTTLGALGSLCLILGACSSGDDDDASGTNGTPGVVNVRMVDNDFDPSALAVEKGDTVTFRFTNQGTLDHDAFVGTPEEQVDHETEMADDSSTTSSSAPMGDGSDEPSGPEGDLVVPPGQTGELSYTFDQAGVFEIGCHQPGHYDSGMKVHIVVED